MKQSDNEPIFSNYKTPYSDLNKGMDYLYEQYKADPEKIVINKGKKYYKIIKSFVLTVPGKNPTIVATVDMKFPIKTKDTVADNYGKKYFYYGNSHVSFAGEIPEWYLNTISLCLSGSTNIGEYVTIY